MGNFATPISAVFGALSIPVSALAGFDDDGNTRLSVVELQRHHAAFQQQVSSRLQLYNGTEHGTRDFLHLSVELVENDDLFGQNGAEQPLAIKAMHEGLAEMAVLRARHPARQFFQSPTRVAAQYTALGVDRVLFLLTIIAAAGWRYWLTVLTSFTIAPNSQRP